MLQAARKIRDAGYRVTDAFTPFPVHGVIEALGARKSRIAGLMLIGGITGCTIGLSLQYWVSSVTYPHIVSGRPFFSWPNFIPVVFECTVLIAALTGVISMLALNGLPRPYHPIFSANNIERASTDKFFLFIKATDPLFDLHKTGEFLKSLKPDRVDVVPVEPSGKNE